MIDAVQARADMALHLFTSGPRRTAVQDVEKDFGGDAVLSARSGGGAAQLGTVLAQNTATPSVQVTAQQIRGASAAAAVSRSSSISGCGNTISASTLWRSSATNHRSGAGSSD